MIFLDTNVPMYAGGADHPLKGPCQLILDLAGRVPSQFITNAEVLQEIIHRYTAIRRWGQGRELFREFAALMEGRIESVLASDAVRAAEYADRYPQISARDCLHAAVMERVGALRIASTDIRFDIIVGITRLDPARVDEWRSLVVTDTDS